ncbi:hypothetical protein C6N75_26970 [Streptomyces solincola]|uniref:Uncharacterized protein n=1 Tax=Streptomyces solincola TaxID=2100817 RepID=A0A2S9PP41_9ACTN|nr:hypothetical protein [Streptomyces solincola]PRH76190.1 hypothetical protein C6N75_26970 [Streptomyces solincola]
MAHEQSGGRHGPVLQHGRDPWAGASATAAELRVSAAEGRTGLGAGHDGLTARAAGLAAAAALAGVLTSWEDRLAAIRDECDHLSGTLRQATAHLGEVDTATAGAVAR